MLYVQVQVQARKQTCTEMNEMISYCIMYVCMYYHVLSCIMCCILLYRQVGNRNQPAVRWNLTSWIGWNMKCRGMRLGLGEKHMRHKWPLSDTTMTVLSRSSVSPTKKKVRPNIFLLHARMMPHIIIHHTSYIIHHSLQVSYKPSTTPTLDHCLL